MNPPMPVVPYDAVLDAWNELNAGAGDGEEEEAPSRLDEIVARFRHEQPALAGYLQAAEEALETSALDERGLIFFHGLWAWLAFKKCGGADREITEEMIEAAHDANELEMEELAAAPEKGWLNHAREMTKEYRQMALLGAVTEAVMDPGLLDLPRADDIAGVILLHVKTAIDSLDLASR